MSQLVVIISIVVIAILVIIFTDFRFLLYPFNAQLNPMTTAKKYELTGNTLFISDLHLRAGIPFQFTEQLRACIEGENIRNLVIDGDLFDSPEDAKQILRTSNKLDFLGLRDIPLKSYWILGSPRHDPSNPTTTIDVLGYCAIFTCYGVSVVAYHGQDLSLKGGIAHGINKFISPLIVEKMWRLSARVDHDTWVIFGHTHIPGLDMKSRIGNCGAWPTYRLVRPTKTGIVLSKNEPRLRLVIIA